MVEVLNAREQVYSIANSRSIWREGTSTVSFKTQGSATEGSVPTRVLKKETKRGGIRLFKLR